jgi:hypothetical protein
VGRFFSTNNAPEGFAPGSDTFPIVRRVSADTENPTAVIFNRVNFQRDFRHNLACYCCRLGNLKEAMQWLEKAIDLAGKKDIRMMALDDPDLEPLWCQISEI